jgi:hypothetical protein
MKLFRTKKEQIIMPKGWHQVTLAQYEDVIESLKGLEDNFVIAWANAIAAVTGKQPKEILQQPMATINKQISQLDFMADTGNQKFVNEFDLCGTTYVCEPQIHVVSPDRFIFFQKVLAETGVRQKARLLAIFVHPKGKSFDGQDYEQVAEMLYQHCTCDVLLPMYVFFCNLGKASEEIMRSYLMQTMEGLKQEVNQVLKESVIQGY